MPAPGTAIPRRVRCGRSAAGSASPCQGEGRGFESRRPLGMPRGFPSNGKPERIHGGVAERRGNGLQSRLHGFKSRLHLAKQAARPEVPARSRTCSAARLAHLPDTEGVPSSNLGRCTKARNPLSRSRFRAFSMSVGLDRNPRASRAWSPPIADALATHAEPGLPALDDLVNPASNALIK